MKKRLNAKYSVICSALAASMLVGCAGIGNINPSSHMIVGKDRPAAANEVETKTEQVSKMDADYSVDFNKDLIEFVEKNGFAEENYMVSPTSLRAAIALAVAGADTDTKEELIHAMGFENMNEVIGWYSSVNQIVNDFDKDIKEDIKDFESQKEWMPDNAKAPEGQLVMLNSIWNNTDLNGKFGKDYMKYVRKNFGAEAYEVGSKDITDKVNNWVSEGTNDLIPSISDDMSYVNAALINTLYLKSAWATPFEDYATEYDTFTTSKGKHVQKEFMNQQDRFSFYEDENGKLIVLPLNGGVNAIFVLGEIDDLQDALKKASYEEVTVKLPKFEVESSFSNNELVDFLQKLGAGLAFTGNADFSIMCPERSWTILDIIQKTKIKVDEDGLEAAAATAMMMCESAAIMEDEPKEFIADEPFRFYICGGENNSETLFCGQIVE